jgi:hypothetical protein
MLRMVRRGLLAVCGLALPGRAQIRAAPAQQPIDATAIRLVAGCASPSIQSDNPNDFVQVRDGRFVLGGKPFIIKGTNYFGSWLHHSSIDAGNGIEHVTVWALYHDWDSQKVDLDLRFIRSQLSATAVRVGTPAKVDFGSFVRYHGYQPWYLPDGTIAQEYKSELIQLADIAYRNGMRIQFCLLWNVGSEIARDPEAFRPGGEMDRLYSNQVRSIAIALRKHPAVIGYSIGNEVLINWPLNGTHTSWYEVLAAGFILRRLREIRTVAPHQLLTTDESAASEAKEWYAIGPEFATLSGVDVGTGSQSVRLTDEVDYLGPHLYPEALRPEDLPDGFGDKIADTKRQLAVYLRAAGTLAKPVVINEFGLQISPEVPSSDDYSPIRDRLFSAVIAEGQKLGLQGLLAWDAIPEIALDLGHYRVRASKLNPSSSVEVDIDLEDRSRRRQILFYEPRFNLFQWQRGKSLPSATAAAKAIASAWANIPQPSQVPPQKLNR